MSSSDKWPDWNVFTERATPFAVELLSPASEIAAVLQKYQASQIVAQQMLETVQQEGLVALAQQAVFVVQLAAALERYEADLAQATLTRIHRHLRVLKDQMIDALHQAGLTIEMPIGKPFHEVADWVQVEGWRHHEQFASEVVAEVVEPIVTYRDDLIRLGRVIMGAPPQEEV